MANKKLRDLTKPEIDILLKNCNFTDEEETYFRLKVKDKTNVYISIEMNVSEQQVCKLARRVRIKIDKILNMEGL